MMNFIVVWGLGVQAWKASLVARFEHPPPKAIAAIYSDFLFLNPPIIFADQE